MTTTRRKTKEEFIENARKVHGNKYDYSKVSYINNRTKVCIICPIHGEFWQTPYHHLNGNGCKKCANDTLWKSKRKKIDFSEFKERVINKYGNVYDFSKTDYIDTHTKIVIGYNGKFFETIPSRLLLNSRKKPIMHDFVENKNDFIKKSKELYGQKYDYTNVEYIDSKTKVRIICPIHGEFWQKPNYHLNGCQCPMCNCSKLENEIREILDKYNINYVEQFSPNFLNFKCSHQKYDFYLKDYNIALECQGKQHFYVVKKFGDKKSLDENKKRDLKKYNNSHANGVDVLYYIDSHILLSDVIYNDEYNCIYTVDNTFKSKTKLVNKILGK